MVKQLQPTVFYLDTNLIVRLVMHDSDEWTPIAEAIFEAAGQLHTLLLTTVVTAETIFVLTSRYQVTRHEVLEAMQSIFDLPGVLVEEEAIQRRTLALYRQMPKLHVVDCYLIARAEADGKGVASFDQRIAKVGLVPVLHLPPADT